MAEKSYYDSLKAGLEDAVAFINGDTSRGRVVVREKPVPDYQAESDYTPVGNRSAAMRQNP